MRHRSEIAIVLALLLVFGACGDDDDTTATTAGGGASTTATTAAGTTTTKATTTTTEPPTTTTTTMSREDPVWVWITDYMGRVAKISFPDETCEWADVGWSANYVTVAHGFVWVTDCRGKQLVRFSVDTLEENGRLDLGGCPTSLWATEDAIWVSLDVDMVVAIDPVTGEFINGALIEGLLTMAAWNPKVATTKEKTHLIPAGWNYHLVINDGSDGVHNGQLPAAAWNPDWGYGKQALRKGDAEPGHEDATIIGRTYHHDPDDPSAPPEAWTDIVTFHTQEPVENHHEYRIPGSHHGNYYYGTLNTIEWTLGGFTVHNGGGNHLIWFVDGPSAHTSAGLIGLASMHGEYYHLVNPADLTGGLDLNAWAGGAEPPALIHQPTVVTHPIGEWCGDIYAYESFLNGPTEYQRQMDLAAAVDASLFTRAGPAELTPAERGIFINRCSMTLTSGVYEGSTFTISEPEAGVEVHLDIQQGDRVFESVAVATTDADGAGEFPEAPDMSAYPDFDPTQPYEIIHRMAGEQLGQGCNLEVRP